MGAIGVNPGAPPSASYFTTKTQAQYIQMQMVLRYAQKVGLVDSNPGVTDPDGSGSLEYAVTIPGLPPIICGILQAQMNAAPKDAEGNPIGEFRISPAGQPYFAPSQPPPSQQPTPVPGPVPDMPFPGGGGSTSQYRNWKDSEIEQLLSDVAEIKAKP